MRFRLFFLSLLFVFGASSGFATEVYFPGTFDLFHLTHYREAEAALESDPGARLKILPIEAGYYNVKDGLVEPRVIPYDLSLRLIADSFHADPRVSVSPALRQIPSNVFKSITDILAKSPDPDKKVMIGSDVLEKWATLPGFEQFKSRVSILVDEDPTDSALNRKLHALFAGDRNVRFVRSDGEGIRSSKVLDELVASPDAGSKSLAAGYRDYFQKYPAEERRILWAFRSALKNYVAEAARKEILPLLNEPGKEEIDISVISKDPAFLTAMATTSPDDEKGLERLVERYVAIMSLDGFDDRTQIYQAFKRALSAARSRPLAASFSYLRSFEERFHVPPPPLDASLKRVAPPAYLFHWTDHTKMEAMARYNSDAARLPTRFIKSHQYVTLQYPELAGRSGIFAWSNPLTGMAASSSELYAWRDGDHPPRLLAMRPKANAQAVELRTVIDSEPGKKIPDLDGIDLILNHTYDKQGRFHYSEWIVLNPDAIEEFSADPKAIRPLLEAELQKLKDPEFSYSEQELMSNYKNKVVWRNVAQDYLNSGSSGIPADLMRPLSPIACVSQQLKSRLRPNL